MIIIDRFESDKAVLEIDDEKMRVIEKSLLPVEAKEGDVIEITVNYEKTQELRQKNLEMMKKLGL